MQRQPMITFYSEATTMIASGEIDTEQKTPRSLRRGVFAEVSRMGEFTSLIGCGGLSPQRLVYAAINPHPLCGSLDKCLMTFAFVSGPENRPITRCRSA